MNRILEDNLWGSAYCEYRPGMEADVNFSALRRAYPMITAGKLNSYHYDDASLTLKLSYLAKTDDATIVYLPFEPKFIESNQNIHTEFQSCGDGAFLYSVFAKPDCEVELTVKGI